jgi:hypothetical protein
VLELYVESTLLRLLSLLSFPFSFLLDVLKLARITNLVLLESRLSILNDLNGKLTLLCQR